ncbi:hypothetical protein SBA5_60017 [Candidatus Sulfotelmatomonas gaucii]|uniref:Uncharacterized protein n=1 Tax=Candidatus Sulfuritelmatomonas gaucii TaxID=2043161 RepID=A0A2N9LWK6_9BACT|nr:hypothetical protein SBA5_60017 [Candidatus Sulfotelmatomonas gaucii]
MRAACLAHADAECALTSQQFDMREKLVAIAIPESLYPESATPKSTRPPGSRGPHGQVFVRWVEGSGDLTPNSRGHNNSGIAVVARSWQLLLESAQCSEVRNRCRFA